MSEELSYITSQRARKAVIEAGYDTLEKAYAAGAKEITDLKFVGGQTWDEIVAEWNLRARAVAAELGQDEPPPGEPAELPLPPVVYEPPSGDPQEVPEGGFPIRAIPESEVKEPDAGGEIVRDEPTFLDMSPYFQSAERADFDSKLLAALEGEGSLEAAYGAIEDSLIAQRTDGIGNVAGVEVDELMRSYITSLTILRERNKAPLLQALLMGWVRQAVDLGLVPEVSDWIRTSQVPEVVSPALAAMLPYEQVYLEPPAEPWPVG